MNIENILIYYGDKQRLKMNLRFKNSPYFVCYSNKVEKAIEYAKRKGLLQKYKINPILLKHYSNKKLNIPLWVVEAACEVNFEDINIPAQYQYLWYCLHNTILTRKQPSGKIFRTKVNFTSIYLEQSKELKNLLLNACETMNLPLYKFNKLCGYKKALSYAKKSIPLIAVLKICQILNLNIWNLLERRNLFSKNKREGTIIVPKNDIDLFVLLVWLRTEGHIELGSTHIEINQKNNIGSLERLRNLFKEKFNLKNVSSKFPKGIRGEDRLIITSSPLRQLLCLKYNFPLGYKSCCLNSMNFEGLSKNDYYKILAAFVQTEGCLSYQYTRNKKKKLPRFEFIVKDEALAKDCLIILRKLGYSPLGYKDKQNLFKVGLYKSKQVIDLVNNVKPYVFNENKINYLRKVCTNGIGL